MSTILVLAAFAVDATSLASLVLGTVVGGAGWFFISRVMGKNVLSEAKRQADDALKNAQHHGDMLRKQIELDTRNEVAQRREEFEREINEARNESKEAERRLTKREDGLDRKLDVLTTKEKYLNDRENQLGGREKKAAAKEADLDQLILTHKTNLRDAGEQQKNELLRIANLSPEDARREAMHALEQESQQEAGQLIQRKREQAEEECRENAQRITLQAIQRFASEHTATNTTSAIAIPSDDMKGRVIGREGRNIRAFEKATGVDVIVDDTPGVVVVSCFDPIRRVVAAESLQLLLDDGRIHPTRIEEVVEQMHKEVEERLVKFGKETAIEVNLPGLHPRINETMGRLQYRTSYGQNILRHSVEVAFLCQVIADELGLDGQMARRCGYLHDIGKALDHEVEGGHPAIGAEFCKRLGEGEEVLNAIAGHHNDIPSTSPYTPIVMAADAISGARPGARRETLEKYIKRLEQLEAIATDMKGVQAAYAIQAGREVRVIVDPDSIDDTNCSYIARNIAKRVSEEMTFPGEIKVTVLREMRTIEYAH